MLVKRFRFANNLPLAVIGDVIIVKRVLTLLIHHIGFVYSVLSGWALVDEPRCAGVYLVANHDIYARRWMGGNMFWATPYFILFFWFRITAEHLPQVYSHKVLLYLGIISLEYSAYSFSVGSIHFNHIANNVAVIDHGRSKRLFG